MPSRQPKRRDAIQTRAALLAAAAEAFAQHGFENAKVREVCRTAGVNLGAVSHYFGSKEALYQEVLMHSHEDLFASEPVPKLQRGDDPQEVLREWVQYMLRFILIRRPSHPHAGRLMAWEIHEPTAAMGGLVTKVMLPVRGELEKVVKALLGKADTPKQRHQCTTFVLGLCVFHELAKEVLKHFGHPVPRSEPEVAALADTITDFALGGIAQIASSGKRS